MTLSLSQIVLILVALAGGAGTPLAPGSDGHVLTMVAGAPAWAAP